LLGPPTHRNAWEPVFQEVEPTVARLTKHLDVSELRIWDKWVDPQDENNWVAVYFAGDKVYYKTKNGQGRRVLQ
jgi:hypothetical protein